MERRISLRDDNESSIFVKNLKKTWGGEKMFGVVWQSMLMQRRIYTECGIPASK